MSLPSGFIEELRARLSLSQVIGRKLSWDAKKTNIGKGDYWAPCPFHQEKTASFHVDDRKGFYYCFGCHQKGDAINFIRETENVGFIEAVEILAREAGMSIPEPDPKAQEKYSKNKILIQVMEYAVQFYRLQINTNNGAIARDYLAKRELSLKIQSRFEIGFSPNDRSALITHLLNKNCDINDIIDCGMAIKPDNNSKPYDRFRGRIMFPIRNTQGHCIAFGGRALDPNARAKYLNSPETPLFNKGRSLYNHAPARQASGQVDALIVTEGYMDVIALAQYGFDHVLAPLGTAITTDQLTLMWRVHHEPIIALDGDKAGFRAALRLIDIALPLLEVGKSLRFCILPEGLDPDDLLKSSGAQAMKNILSKAQPMVNLLWQRETDGKIFDSPERRANLDANLRSAILNIKDRSLRSHYGQAIKELRIKLFAASSTGIKKQAWVPFDKRNKIKSSPSSSAKTSLLATETIHVTTRIRQSIILAAAFRNPIAALKFETALEKMHFITPELQKIQNALLANLQDNLPKDNAENITIQAATTILGYNPIERLFLLNYVSEHPHLQSDASMDMIERTLREELTKHAALIGAEYEIKEAEQDLEGLANEGMTWRIQQATSARNKATRANDEKYNNSSENERNLKKNLQKMLDDQIWVKKKP